MALAGVQATNQALDGINAVGTPTNLMSHVALHTGAANSISTTGANENTGGSYTRQACTWNAAASGSKTNSSALTFTTLGATPVTQFGTWSAVSGGIYGIGGNLSSSVTAVTITVAAGALTLTAA